MFVDGVAKGGGPEDDHNLYNGVHLKERAASGCTFFCDISPLNVSIYTVGESCFLGASDSNLYNHDLAFDPPFRLPLGVNPRCDELFHKAREIPYSPGWHDRQTPINNVNFENATVIIQPAKREGLYCNCAKVPGAGSPCGNLSSLDLCDSLRIPFAGIKVEIEDNNTPELDGVYELTGPPCTLQLGAAALGWWFPVPQLDQLNRAYFTLQRLDAPFSSFNSSGSLNFDGGLTHWYVRYIDATPARDCLGWENVSLPNYDEFGTASHIYDFGGGTITVSALPFGLVN